MVDTRDLKSLARKGVWVQVPPVVRQAEVAQLVEHDLAKVGVASSSLVFRSNKETSQCGVSSFFKHIVVSLRIGDAPLDYLRPPGPPPPGLPPPGAPPPGLPAGLLGVVAGLGVLLGADGLALLLGAPGLLMLGVVGVLLGAPGLALLLGATGLLLGVAGLALLLGAGVAGAVPCAAGAW